MTTSPISEGPKQKNSMAQSLPKPPHPHISRENILGFLNKFTGKKFLATPPYSYGWNDGNSMRILVRNPVTGEDLHIHKTVVFLYWSNSDTQRRVDLFVSREGEIIEPIAFNDLGFQESHYADCLKTLACLVEGTLEPSELCNIESSGSRAAAIGIS